MATSLEVPAAPPVPSKVVAYDPVESSLRALREEYSGQNWDLADPSQYRAAKAARIKLMRLRTGLEELRKQTKAPALAYVKDVDGEAKRIEAAILELEEPLLRQITEHDQRIERAKTEAAEIEGARVRKNRELLAHIQATPSRMIGVGPVQISEEIDNLNRLSSADYDQDFAADIRAAARDAAATLLQMRAQAVAVAEADAVRLRLEQENAAAALRAKAEQEARDVERREEMRMAAQRERLAGLRALVATVLAADFHAGDIETMIRGVEEGHGWPPRGAFDPDFAAEAEAATRDVAAALRKLQLMSPPAPVPAITVLIADPEAAGIPAPEVATIELHPSDRDQSEAEHSAREDTLISPEPPGFYAREEIVALIAEASGAGTIEVSKTFDIYWMRRP